MDAQAVAALGTPAGQALLTAAEAAYAETLDPLVASRRFHAVAPAGIDPALLAEALTQARLRRRARPRLGSPAARMLLTADGLEQASRWSVATHRATRIAARLGSQATVADLCCGIGGDLLALAAAGLDVTGVDSDPTAVAVAGANLQALALASRARVVEGDVTAVDRTAYTACVLDPARRGPRGRSLDPDRWSPPWVFAEQVLRGTACVKAAPGLAHARLPVGTEAEWVSDGGDLVEVAVWSGALAAGASGGPVARRATLLPSGITLTDRDDPGAGTGPVARWLLEPDPAVLRAGLVTGVAAREGGHLLDERIAYIAVDLRPDTSFGRAFEVLDVLPYDLTRLRAYLRERGVGVLTVKKRGVGVEPEQLRRQMRLSGSEAATVIVTRVIGRAAVLVVRPL